MAVDEDLNVRLREALAKQKGISEKRMMGGTCFLLNGHMVGGADRTKDGERRFLFRVGKDNHETAASLAGAQPLIQGGRRMSGFFFVSEEVCDDDILAAWLELAVTNALALKPK